MILSQIQNYIKAYINHQKAKNLSKNTISAYLRVFDIFYDFFAGEVSGNQIQALNEVNNAFLATYIHYCQNELNLSNATRKLHITVIKQFFWYVAEFYSEHTILRSRVTGIKIKMPDNEVESFTSDEQTKIKSLIASLDNSKSYRNHRMSIILKLLLYHGIRVDELITLKWNNVVENYDETYGYIYRLTYSGKGSKERTLDITVNLLERNFEIIKKHIKSEYVIQSYSGIKCSRNTIYISVKNILAKQNITNVWLHKFRHTFGQNKVNEGVNLSTITELMGHSGPEVTFKYYLRGNQQAKRKAILHNIVKNV